MKFTLHVTEAEVNLIGQVLQEAPFKIVAPLIQKLQQQVNEQNAPNPDSPAPADPA